MADWALLSRYAALDNVRLLDHLPAGGQCALANGNTVLHVAARHASCKLVTALCQQPGAVRWRNKDWRTPLHEAAQSGCPRVVQALLEAGAEVDAPKRAGWTPLMLACTDPGAGAGLVIRELLKFGAKPSLRNKDGWNCAHICTRTGDLANLKALAECAPDCLGVATSNGRTLLHIASLHGHAHIVEWLLRDCRASHSLSPDCCGNTPVHEACLGGHEHVLRLLVAAGGSVSAFNHASMSPLHFAAGRGHEGLVRHLVQDHALPPDWRNGQGACTALNCAARSGQRGVVRELTRLGANPGLVDEHGRTAEDYLKLSGSQSAI